MRVRHYHQMSAGVGILIQDYENELPAKQDTHPLIVVGREHLAEDASRFLLGARDVSITPGTPDVIHSAESDQLRPGIAGGFAAGAAARMTLTQSFNSLLGLKYGMRLGGT